MSEGHSVHYKKYDVCQAKEAVLQGSLEEAVKPHRNRGRPATSNDSISKAVQGCHSSDDIHFGATCALNLRLQQVTSNQIF